MPWTQFLGTCGAFATVAASGAAVFFPIRSRRDAALAAKLAADDEAKAAKVVERDAELKRTIQAAITTAIDKSDALTAEQVGDLQKEIAAVRATGDETKLTIATQFGGNGGGIRQAIDTHGRAIARIEGKLGIEASE